MVKKEHCSQGKIYPDEMEVKFAVAEALIAGRRTSGYHHCQDCGGWHVGPRKKPKIEKCWATAKVCFPTEEAAAKMLVRARQLGREERSYYECRYCKQWHLTSQPQKERKDEGAGHLLDR